MTPDTYIVDRATGGPKETIIGPKEQKTVSAGNQGTRMEDVSPRERDQASLSDDMVKELTETALAIEKLYDGVPKDIEWAFSSGGRLSLLQSRPITNLPVQPTEVVWEPTPPAKILYRRQIVENMPDPICDLFEELYLTEGLESSRTGESMMEGGGPHFITCNGYAYNRADHKGTVMDPTMAPEEMEALSQRMLDEIRQRQGPVAEKEAHDMAFFVSELSAEDKAAFLKVAQGYQGDNLAHDLTMPKSENPTYVANLMESLREHPEGGPVLKAIDAYFEKYGHQGYSLDFIEPTQEDDPSALLATLKTMVEDADYDSKDQELRAAAIREQKHSEISEIPEGLTYWQFRYRLWFARKYNHIREETAFYFGYTWRILRPMAFELGQRMVDIGTFRNVEDTFFLVTDMGSILAHASIVASEYGIRAVLGVGNGTLRIQHGQTLTINGDAGTVVIHEEESAQAQ